MIFPSVHYAFAEFGGGAPVRPPSKYAPAVDEKYFRKIANPDIDAFHILTCQLKFKRML